jgi:hypothetical protein
MNAAPAKHDHPVVFGRREAGCPRCAELAAGAPVVRWARSRREFDRRAAVANARHDCRSAGCGPVCTFGEW